MNRLGVIVPYRDRQEHLEVFVPHMSAYFARDKADKYIPVRLLIVEQPPGLPFNRGLLCNIGFQVLRDETDYTCFHDIDYLPMWADYSYPDHPSMLIGYGLEPRPFQHMFLQRPWKFFSAVVALRNEHIIRANGHSNGYWGWGHEDIDFKRRLEAAGLTCHYRWGTFSGLDHDRRDGITLDGDGYPVHSPVSQQNWEVLCKAWDEPRWQSDGLNSLQFNVVTRGAVDIGKKERQMMIERVVVDFTIRLGQPPVLPVKPSSSAPASSQQLQLPDQQ
jgi:hypothetical protein